MLSQGTFYLKRSNSVTGKQNIWQEFVKVSKRLTPEYLQSVNTNISADENYPEDNMISSTLATNQKCPSSSM